MSKEQEGYSSVDPMANLFSHIKNLGMNSIRAYQQWCKHYSFANTIEKTIEQFQQELDFFNTKCRRTSDIICFKRAIEKIYHQQLTYDDLHRPEFCEIYKIFEQYRYAKPILDILLHLELHSKLLRDKDYIIGIGQILQYRDNWQRSIFKWRPKTRSATKQFSQLLQHLLALYPVPRFMEKAFSMQHKLHQKWFIVMGSGKSIRHEPSLPVKFTKKMTHLFLQTPVSYTIEEGLRRAQVMAIGGNHQLVEVLRPTVMMDKFHQDDFWLTVVHFFINHPQLDRNHVGPLIDYIDHQKYRIRKLHTARGVVEVQPPYPKFCMKGRTASALVKQMHAWHDRLGQMKADIKICWEHSSIKDFTFHEEIIEKKIQKKSKNEKRPKKVIPEKTKVRIWNICQLLSNCELFSEGNRLKHCVGLYVDLCVQGHTTIWTMEMEDEKGNRRKRLTIEVDPLQKLVVQARGRCNRKMESEEKKVLLRWCSQEFLTVASYVCL